MPDVGHILFQGWTPLLRTAIGTTVTYVALVVLLRIAGPRTLAKWYAFDLIVTVALGSTFANSGCPATSAWRSRWSASLS